MPAEINPTEFRERALEPFRQRPHLNGSAGDSRVGLPTGHSGGLTGGEGDARAGIPTGCGIRPRFRDVSGLPTGSWGSRAVHGVSRFFQSRSRAPSSSPAPARAWWQRALDFFRR